MKTGEVEVVATELRILSESETPPFVVGDTTAGEMLRLKYRYLDLRREQMQRNLLMRSKAAHCIREYLDENGFLEIETPFLGKSTPEGARDYLVPSRIHIGEYYALPQSPQLYKQLLMIGGFDRYYQMAKCFRDEDLRANRQPEFTQVDLEMSFVDSEEDVMQMTEGLILKLFKSIKGIDLPHPFNRMLYSTAMEKYGSDKPDLRFGMEIFDMTNECVGSGFAPFDSNIDEGGSVQSIKVEGGETIGRKDLDAYAQFVKTYKVKGLMWLGMGENGVLRSSYSSKITPETLQKILDKTQLKSGDMLFSVSDKVKENALIALGALRCELAKRFDLIKKDTYAITWVTDFPLLEYSEEDKRFVAKHHPFTSPKNEDLPLMKTHPELVRAKAYDLVINGDEMGGGSLRIYNQEVQKLMFETIGMSDEDIKERFGFFVDAFNYGTPPHGGLAFGFDRLMMVLCQTDSIRDVIAFPKIQNASCMMTEAPTAVENKQLMELSIKNWNYAEDKPIK
ncbi:MAG: aspartate--tRNA ligase, partial [Clostridia bacterium]